MQVVPRRREQGLDAAGHGPGGLGHRRVRRVDADGARGTHQLGLADSSTSPGREPGRDGMRTSIDARPSGQLSLPPATFAWSPQNGYDLRGLDAAATAPPNQSSMEISSRPRTSSPVVPQTNHVVAPEEVRLASFCPRGV